MTALALGLLILAEFRIIMLADVKLECWLLVRAASQFNSDIDAMQNFVLHCMPDERC